MKPILSVLLLASALTSAACFESNARSTSDPQISQPAPPITAGGASTPIEQVRASDDPAAIRLLYFCYQHDHILQQAREETDEAFAQRLRQEGHGAPSVALQRQQILAAGTTSQLEQDLRTLYEWRETFQNDADRYGMKAAEWCADQTTSAARMACINYTRFQRGSEGRLALVNERIAQLERRAGLPPSAPDGGAAERDSREGRRQVEEDYRKKMKEINDEEKAWNREKRDQDAKRPGNPYQNEQ